MSALELFVPGRLCLFGEHSDWAGAYRARDASLMPGYCLAVGTTQGIQARVTPHPSRLIVDSHVVDGSREPLSAPLDGLSEIARSGGFYAYSAGVAAFMCERYRVGGANIQTTTMNLPLKKGLSSSAAICVLTARALNRLYHLGLSLGDEMECAYQGEILTGSQCGRLDQVCAYGQTPVFLTFDGDQLDVQALMPAAPMHFVIVDLQGKKDTRRILRDLNAAFRSDSRVGAQVRDALGSQNHHIVTEARRAFEVGDARRVGDLMHEAQWVFDRQVAPASAAELTAPKLHAVLSDPFVHERCWGGKGVGSQGDGCAQLLARDSAAQRQLLAELPRHHDVRCLELSINALEGVVA